MNPFLIGLLAQGGGGLLSSLFGARQSRQAAARERAYRANIMRVASPDYLRTLQQQLYNQSLAGPAFQMGQRGIFNAGTNLTNRLQGSLAARGLTNSGIGSLAPALAGSSMAGQLGGLRAGLYGQAGQQAESQQARQLAALSGLGPQPTYNYGSQAFGGMLGDIGQYITQYYGQPRQPNMLPPAYSTGKWNPNDVRYGGSF